MVKFKRILSLLPLTFICCAISAEHQQKDEEHCIKELEERLGVGCLGQNRKGTTVVYQFRLNSERTLEFKGDPSCKAVYYSFMSDKPECFDPDAE